MEVQILSFAQRSIVPHCTAIRRKAVVEPRVDRLGSGFDSQRQSKLSRITTANNLIFSKKKGVGSNPTASL